MLTWAYLQASGEGRDWQNPCKLGSLGSTILGQGLLVDRELDGVGSGTGPQVVHPRLQASLQVHLLFEIDLLESSHPCRANPCKLPDAKEGSSLT